jgi:hypothetical protein
VHDVRACGGAAEQRPMRTLTARCVHGVHTAYLLGLRGLGNLALEALFAAWDVWCVLLLCAEAAVSALKLAVGVTCHMNLRHHTSLITQHELLREFHQQDCDHKDWLLIPSLIGRARNKGVQEG